MLAQTNSSDCPRVVFATSRALYLTPWVAAHEYPVAVFRLDAEKPGDRHAGTGGLDRIYEFAD